MVRYNWVVQNILNKEEGTLIIDKEIVLSAMKQKNIKTQTELAERLQMSKVNCLKCYPKVFLL